MRKRRNVALLLAVVVGMMLVPAMSASAASKHENKQNAAIGKASKAAARALTRIAALTTVVGDQTKTLADLQTLTNGIDGRLKFIEGAAPQLVDGLTKLQTAALQLKAGLETAGAGLTSLKTLATSQEYGIGQVIVLVGATPTPEAGSFVQTPDIPDAVQQAQTEQVFKAQHIGTLIVQYAVRSNENDGDGTVPAALCKVTVTNELGATQSTAANAAIGGLPFQPVPDKSAMTSTLAGNEGFPFGLKLVAPDQDKTVTLATAIPVDNTDAANDTYTVGMSCVDTSPDATNPAA
jgi:hypothetical protein